MAQVQVQGKGPVVILGGGLAGLSAGCRLVEEGLPVLLLERRGVLGGRASSLPGWDGEVEVDNCQHILLRCCTHLLDFYRQIGVAEKIKWYSWIPFLGSEKRLAYLYPSKLPYPFHLLPSLLRFPFLKRSHRYALVLGIARLWATPSNKVPEISVGEWLKAVHQPVPAIEYFWEPILVSALNESLYRASLKYARQVFAQGFLGSRHSYEMGVPACPLSDLYGPPCEEYITQRGGQIRLRTAVTRLDIQGNHCLGVQTSEGYIPARAVISAVPYEALLKLLPHQWLEEPPFKDFELLGSSPIVAVYFWFDRPITSLPQSALLGRRFQWMFNKRIHFQLPEGGDYIGLVWSAAREVEDRSREEILRIAKEDLLTAFPQARSARVLREVVVRESRATFSVFPGCDQYRPDTRTPIQNLYLAGDWTQTGWPATMEGAVISGRKAAEALLADQFGGESLPEEEAR